MKYGGKCEGIVPELLDEVPQHARARRIDGSSKSTCSVVALPGVPRRSGSMPQARAVTRDHGAAEVRRASQRRTLPRSLRPGGRRRGGVLSASWSSTPTQQMIAAEVLKEIRGRLGFLINVGLDYLTLDRTAPTLSGGESQRIRLAGQIGCGLVGVLYILDEPSIGLHPRDNDRLLRHAASGCATWATPSSSSSTTKTRCGPPTTSSTSAPAPACAAARSSSQGPPDEVIEHQRSLTGQVPLRREADRRSRKRRRDRQRQAACRSSGATHNNLKNIDVEIPLGAFVCVTGVSGSGKSSLVNDILVETLHRDLNKGEGDARRARAIEGLEHLDKVIDIDQSPIGRTPRSNPATYIKVFDEIRDLFAQLPEAKMPRLQAGPVQLQRRRRPLRGLRGQRLEPAGDGLPRRRLGDLPGLRGQALQPRDAAGPFKDKSDRRRAGDGRAAGARALRERAARSATSCRRCTTSASTTSSSASPRRRSPAARPSGSSWPASW